MVRFLFNEEILFYFMCATLLPACMSMAHMSALPTETKEGIESPGIGDIDSCEQPASGTGDQTQNYLCETSRILTTELFLQLQKTDIFVIYFWYV